MRGVDFTKLSRRELFRLSLLSAGGTIVGARKALAGIVPCNALPPQPYPIDIQTGLTVIEAFPSSPFILRPFNDPLPIPKALTPGWLPSGADPSLSGNRLAWSDSNAWSVRQSAYGLRCTPGPDAGHQDSLGDRPRSAGGSGIRVPDAGTHQCWPGTAGSVIANYPQPIYYHLRLQVNTHSFTSSPVQPIGAGGALTTPPANVFPNASGQYFLPPTTIYGFNGTFPGPMINAEYGRPVCIRFENDIDLNPLNLDRGDFGAPDWAFLTHLHNGHTAPESDGNPNHMTDMDGGYQPGHWVDNLYLNHPAGGDSNEKQSFLWFHDHRMHHTGANVYKGMVGLFPIYDPVLDPGDETIRTGLQLPGRRVNNPDGTFDVKYDIPLALYDCCFDDGITPHQDFHNGCGELHPESWGKTYFRHMPNHGFVGDVFTINGTAYPKLDVYRRKYRFRFLDASVARCYELMIMRGTPTAAPGTQGQWSIPDGQQCMRWTQIASEGGLLPKPIIRDSFQIWPAKRREFVLDFTKYMDGSPTRPGDVVYLVNVLEMPDGRKPNFNAPGATLFYKVPIMKFVIGGNPPEPDVSVVKSTLRPMPALPKKTSALPTRSFTLQRGSAPSGETQWLINGLEFNALAPLAVVSRSSSPQGEVWTIANGGGGWVHPMHLHQEEHTVLSRTGSTTTHPDDTGKEDVIALDPAESVTLYRQFRTYYGNYVAHCHNLAHEDHNMMFGWCIVP